MVTAHSQKLVWQKHCIKLSKKKKKEEWKCYSFTFLENNPVIIGKLSVTVCLLNIRGRSLQCSALYKSQRRSWRSLWFVRSELLWYKRKKARTSIRTFLSPSLLEISVFFKRDAFMWDMNIIGCSVFRPWQGCLQMLDLLQRWQGKRRPTSAPTMATTSLWR